MYIVMKANVNRTLNTQYQKSLEERQREEEKYIESLSEEDKIKYKENKAKRVEQSVRLLELMTLIAKRGPYGDFI